MVVAEVAATTGLATELELVAALVLVVKTSAITLQLVVMVKVAVLILVAEAWAIAVMQVLHKPMAKPTGWAVIASAQVALANKEMVAPAEAGPLANKEKVGQAVVVELLGITAVVVA